MWNTKIANSAANRWLTYYISGSSVIYIYLSTYQQPDNILSKYISTLKWSMSVGLPTEPKLTEMRPIDVIEQNTKMKHCRYLEPNLFVLLHNYYLSLLIFFKKITPHELFIIKGVPSKSRLAFKKYFLAGWFYTIYLSWRKHNILHADYMIKKIINK